MGNTIRMDLYRLFISKTFKINLIIVAMITLISKPLLKFVFNITAQLAENVEKTTRGAPPLPEFPASVNLSELIATPFGYYFLTIFCLMSVITFAYADIANGYVKNYAGQLVQRGLSVVSKFVVILIHNFIFMFSSLLASVIGEIVTRKIALDSDIPQSIGTFFLKLMLLQALCTIILFFATGIRHKNMATIFGVFLGSGMLGLAYFGLNMAIGKIFVRASIDVTEYAPDELLRSGANIAAANALIVSSVIIVVFLPLTIRIFETKDIK